MNKHIEALKMEIDDARIGLGKVRQYLGWQEPKEDELCLEILKAWKTLDACKEALAEAEKQDIGEAEIRQMLKDIEYYQKRVEELEQPAQSACEECMGFNKQLADENDSLKSRIAELQRYAETMVNRPTNPATWQSLSDDEIASVIKTTFPVNVAVTNVDLKFARAIEQALKEKNHGNN